MNIESIKRLIKEGDIPQARNQLEEALSKTPEDTVAQMLYGTCCQLMGDSATFGRIYRDLAPEMELRVAHGERSERVSMWLKYVAMFAVVFSLVGCASCANEGISSLAIGEPSNETRAVTAVKDSNLYDSVLKMPLQDQFRFFLKRPEVSRELHNGKLRAVVIPIQGSDEMFEGKVDNLLLIRVNSSLKIGSDVVKVLGKKEGENWEILDNAVFVQFSSFAHAVNPKSAERMRRSEERIRALEKLINEGRSQPELNETKIPQPRRRYLSRRRDLLRRRMKALSEELESERKVVQCLLKGEMIPSKFKKYYETVAIQRVLHTMEKHGDISDLIVSSEEPGSYVLGICFVNIHGSSIRTVYGGPRDDGDRFPKYIKAPDGTILYELTEEMVRKEMEEARKGWEEF